MSIKMRISHIKLVLTIILCAIWVVGCFMGTKIIMIDSTAPLTAKNTYQITVATDNIAFEVVELPNARGLDREQLLIDIGDDRFYVDWWIASKKGTQKGDVFEIIPKLEGETSLTLTIFEDAFVLGERCTVVDVRSPTTVYYDISFENDRQNRDRTIVLWVIWIPILICCVGVYLLLNKLLPHEYRGKFFKKIEDLLEKPIGGSGSKDKTIVPPEKPQKEKRTPSEGALFRDEEE